MTKPETKRPWLVAVLVVVGFLLVGGICFSVGKGAATAEYQQEKELNAQLHRSELEGLGEFKDTIYVTGHKSPDSDTVASSIAYSALLQQLGYDSYPVVLGDINKETTFLLDAAGLPAPEFAEDASGYTVALVDHGEYSQSALGLDDANIVSVIDHHGCGGLNVKNPSIYDSRPLGATATVIWMRYRDYGVEMDKQVAMALAGAIISDTTNLKSKSTTSLDREALKDLSARAGITDIEDFARKLYQASISHEGMTDEEIFFSDCKEYEHGGTRYSIACVSVYDEEEARDMAERMKAVMPGTLKSTGSDMAFTMVSIFHDDLSYSYLIPSDDTASEVLETLFGEKATFDGTSYVINPGFSRRQVLAPSLSDFFESHPHE